MNSLSMESKILMEICFSNFNKNQYYLINKDFKYKTIEADTNKPFKIIERFKYEKTRHIYPCSIWETLDVSNFT